VNCLPDSIIVSGTRLWLPAVPESDIPEPLYPDLIVGKFSQLQVSCSETSRGCVTRVSFSIVNAGTGAAGAFNIRIAADPNQSVIVNLPASGLASGAAQEFAILTPPKGNCFDPDCTVCVTVDSNNNVTESNERNNELCTTSIG
jgi:subtilase family serine protease